MLDVLFWMSLPFLYLTGAAIGYGIILLIAWIAGKFGWLD